MNTHCKKEDPIEQLARLFLFRTWNREDLAWLLRSGSFVTVARGIELFKEGESCDKLIVLVEGHVQMYRTHPNGQKIPLHVVRGQALIACAALFLDQCYPASGIVVSPTATVFEYPGAVFLDLLEKRPDLARKMISALAMRIGELADRLEAAQSLSAVARLGRWLSEQPSSVDKGGKRTIKVQTTKRILAETLNMKPETLSRAFHELETQGIIARRAEGFVILDPDKLVEISQS